MYLASSAVEAQTGKEVKAGMTIYVLPGFEVGTRAMASIFFTTVTFSTEVASLSVLIDLIKLESVHRRAW